MPDRLAIIIPTKDHPAELQRLLDSVGEQTLPPDEVVIVDGSAHPVEGRVRVPSALPRVRFLRVQPPGLAKQANIGARAVDPSIPLVGFLDDDMVLEPDALAAMLAFWERADAAVGGAAFQLTNNTGRPRGVWLKGLFGLDGRRRGALLPSGYNTKIGAVSSTQLVEWLYSGATVWRRAVLEAEPFDEWFEGPGFLYELEFSLRARRRYQLAVVAPARAREVASSRQWDHRRLGQWQVVNRLYIVRKHRGRFGLSLFRCRVALIGQMIVNVWRGVTEDRGYLLRARGNVAGWRQAGAERS